MAVNRKVYDVVGQTLGNTMASALRDQMRQMLIDNGVMTEWHDAWTAGNNRNGNNYWGVLKVTQDANKTYGSYYVVFCFAYEYYDGRVRAGLNTSTGGWNVTSHVPTGTQYLDYYSNPPSDYVWTVYGRETFMNGARDMRLVSYKSGSTLVFGYTDGLYGWNMPMTMFVLQTSLDAQPGWVDLNKVCVPTLFGLTGAAGGYSNQWRMAQFWWPNTLRRFVFPGRSPSGTALGYFNYTMNTSCYMYGGCHVMSDNNNDNNSNTNDTQSTGSYFNYGGAIRLPWTDGYSVASLTSPWAPLVTNIDLARPLNIRMASDFALATLPSRTKSMAQLQRITVSDTEVWEVAYPIASTPNAPNTMALMARVV